MSAYSEYLHSDNEAEKAELMGCMSWEAERDRKAYECDLYGDPAEEDLEEE